MIEASCTTKLIEQNCFENNFVPEILSQFPILPFLPTKPILIYSMYYTWALWPYVQVSDNAFLSCTSVPGGARASPCPSPAPHRAQVTTPYHTNIHLDSQAYNTKINLMTNLIASWQEEKEPFLLFSCSVGIKHCSNTVWWAPRIFEDK